MNSVSVIDLTGAEVAKFPGFSGSETELHLDALEPGVYTIVLKGAAGTVVKKVVKTVR